MKPLSFLPALALLATLAILPHRAEAGAFVAWQVTGVPDGDTLNVRRYPAPVSRKQAAYPNGTVLSMTGRCTGGLDLRSIQRLRKSVQRQRARHAWCEIWHDPARDGRFVSGWVYGRYIAPYRSVSGGSFTSVSAVPFMQ